MPPAAKTKPAPVAAEGPPGTLAALVRKLADRKFAEHQAFDGAGDDEAAGIVWGQNKGVPTPRVFVLALKPENWASANADHVLTRVYALTPTDTPDDAYPQFAVVGDGAHQAVFDLEYPAHEIDQLPAAEEIGEYQRIKADPTYRWSVKVYERLMNGFNAFHEQVYQTVKDKVSGKNDIILEVAKVIFLETFRLNHSGRDLEFECDGQKYRLDQVFTADYVRKEGKEAVRRIQAAFDRFKSHKDYVVEDDAGTRHPIFDEQTHLQLSQPRNLETLLTLVQDLGAVTDNRGREVKPKGTLADVAGDVLGRAFDVFLRANFDSKGGLGLYLTPAPVKQAMLALAFHDILKEDPGLLTARAADTRPAFRYGDPACGSSGFGVVAMGYLERALRQLRGAETSQDVRRDKLFQDMGEHSFIGADSAPMMVTLARVNMAMVGAPRAKIFRTDNSLTSTQLKPGSFDLICTNPPFGTPKFKKGQEASKKAYEADMEKILETFRTDLTPVEASGRGRKPVKADKQEYTYEPTVLGKAMGGQPTGKKGRWKKASPTSIDPAILFLDRCLELLKPGGRLLIVLPDGVLCNSGDKYVREYIMGKKDEATGQFHGGKAIVKAVISLPADTFKLAGTGAKTSILYLQKRHARPDDTTKFEDEPQTEVFMAVADTLGYEVKGNVEDYSRGVPNDLAAITGAYVRGE